MPTFVPDRVPSFDPAAQRWRWWSTPGPAVSFAQDQANAETIDVTWELYDESEGRTWIALTPVLPGFTPFLWAFGRKALWLRRPEGVWTFPLPKGLKRKDHVLVQEPCEGLPHQLNRRYPIECRQAANTNGWHPPYSDITVTLDEHDQNLAGNGPCLVVDGVPTLINHPPKMIGFPPMGPDVSPYLPLHIDLWSRPGPMRFTHRRVHAYGALQDALITALPNGVRIATLYSLISGGETPTFKSFAAILGDDRWIAHHAQPVILDDDL